MIGKSHARLASGILKTVEEHQQTPNDYPFPHENPHVDNGDPDSDDASQCTDSPGEKDHFILADNITARRITEFHYFTKEVPHVICNYCNITSYPEENRCSPNQQHIEVQNSRSTV